MLSVFHGDMDMVLKHSKGRFVRVDEHDLFQEKVPIPVTYGSILSCLHWLKDPIMRMGEHMLNPGQCGWNVVIQVGEVILG